MTRETLLTTLFAAVQQMPGDYRFLRNDLPASEDQVDTIILMDGDEFMQEEAYHRSRPNPAFGNIMVATPEIYIVLHRTTDAGTALNAETDTLRRLIINDASLQAAVLNSHIEYEGMDTAFGLGRALVAEAAMRFSLPYRPEWSAPELPTETES